ncbi:MAG: pyridoxal-phosphate dependent enzyme [Anaerolineae bacterium]|nr:pyridoxal-phosphate dependent enzyme [Anaerolineae bacterium]
MVHAADIILARRRLAGYLRPTPLEAVPGLGDQVWLKLENANRTHSFKVRGALNAMLALSDEARTRGHCHRIVGQPRAGRGLRSARTGRSGKDTHAAAYAKTQSGRCEAVRRGGHFVRGNI